MKISGLIRSMRLRTLPLSESGVLLGTFIAMTKGHVTVPVVISLLLTTALLQILSNLSNELGDTLHGTDTAERQGMHYSIQEGDMTIRQMKLYIAVIYGACCLSGLAMIWFSFGTFLAVEPLALVILGAAAIWAAMHYTLGSNPYGYRGLGDLFVFIFFGLVSVFGGYYVCSHDLGDLLVLLPACGIGCFSIGVLNVNNIRDMKTDAATRTTVALLMGGKRARIYQTVLIALGWLALIVYTAYRCVSWTQWIFLLTIPLFALHLKGVWNRQDCALDPMLPMLVMSTFATVLLYGLGLLLA